MACGGTVLQLAVQVVDELVDQSPAFVQSGLAEQHGAQLGVSGAGLGGVSVSDLALQSGVGQAFPGGGNIFLSDQSLVVDEAHGQGGFADPHVVGILVGIADDIIMLGNEGLEQSDLAGQSVCAASPQNVSLGILSLSSDTLDSLAGGDAQIFHIDVGIIGDFRRARTSFFISFSS